MIKASRGLSSSADLSARFYFVLYREFGVSRTIGQRLKSLLRHDPPQSLGKRFVSQCSPHWSPGSWHGADIGRERPSCRELSPIMSHAEQGDVVRYEHGESFLFEARCKLRP
jgi:hypothetical protein